MSGGPLSRSGGRALAVIALASLAGAGSGCNPFPDFPPESLVDSARILAVRADKPYAAPGDVVHLDVLAVDGRPEKPAPMRVFWVPVPCSVPVAPPELCYPAFTWQFQPGVDAANELHEGDSLSVVVPPDQPVSEDGPSGVAYGYMYVFLMACAGRVEYLGSKAGLGAGGVPFGCFDEAPVDLAAGMTLPRCTAKGEDEKCPTRSLTLLVPKSSREVDSLASGGLGQGGAGSSTDTGDVPQEALWANFFTTLGETYGSALSLYEPGTDKKPFPTTRYSAPKTAGEGFLYAIVRDSGGGVSWLQVPLHIQ